MTEATTAAKDKNNDMNKERNNNSEQMLIEKNADERNTETCENTKLSEVRDNVCMVISKDITCCGKDHLNDKNTLTNLMEYPNM